MARLACTVAHVYLRESVVVMPDARSGLQVGQEGKYSDSTADACPTRRDPKVIRPVNGEPESAPP